MTSAGSTSGSASRASRRGCRGRRSCASARPSGPPSRTSTRTSSPTYTDDDVERLLGDAGIIRHRGKIQATITNARATIALREEGGLVDFVWGFQPADTPRPADHTEVPTVSDESKALSKALRKKGFAFVGPTTMYALMEAVGIIDTHLLGSHRRGSSGVWTA